MEMSSLQLYAKTHILYYTILYYDLEYRPNTLLLYRAHIALISSLYRYYELISLLGQTHEYV
jgi:hypothetical protein